MNNRIRVHLHAWYLLLALPLAWGCATPLPQVEVGRTPSSPEAEGHVVVVKSSDNPFYLRTINAFVEQVDCKITTVTLSPAASDAAIAVALSELKPDVLYTLGARATLIARQRLPKVPSVFSLVPNFRTLPLNLEENGNFAGVSLESPPLSDFTQFKIVLPMLRRVGVFYHPEASSQTVLAAREQLSQLAIELVAVPVQDPANLSEIYTQHFTDLDAVWIQVDPVVMNRESFEFLRRQTGQDGIPLLTSLSDKFAEEGALLSVSLDFRTIGSQAANIVSMYLEQQPIPADQRFQPPVGGKLTLNLKVAKQLGITIPEDAYPYVNRIIVEQRTQ